MVCKKCGKRLKEGEMFCTVCGYFNDPNDTSNYDDNKKENFTNDDEVDLLKEDGSLSYKAAYNMSSLPLVHKGRYEANKHAPQEGSTLWTSSYNSNKDTTMSWGPYKLTYYQEGKQYILSRNTNWYGYNMPENKGKYQTDRIVCETIKEWGTAWLAFLKGEIDSIGIDVSISTDYKESERAINTPDDFVASLQLQSNVEELKKRESEGVNKTILGYTELRKALSLSIDRAEFTRKTTTSSRAGFGLYNQMHYYDVANGGVYRNTDEARKVLCEIYAVDPSKYPSLEEAEKASMVVIMNKGKIIASGSPNELKNKFAKDYIYTYVDFNEEFSKNLAELNYFSQYFEDKHAYKIEISNFEDAKKLFKNFPEMFVDVEIIKGTMNDVFLNVISERNN